MALLILLMCLIQTSLLPHIKLFGSIPSLVLAVLVSAAHYADKRLITSYAVLFGFILGSLGGESFVYYPITYLLAVCVAVIMAGTVSSMPFLISYSAAIIAFVCDSLTAASMTMFASPEAGLGQVLIGTALPQLFHSVLVFPAVYAVCALHKRIFFKA